jgi:hypothetical protein
MATAVKRLLSGSTDGKGIKVTSGSSPGTLIHTAVSGTTPGTYDEVWLWAYNSDVSNVVLFVEFGESDMPRKITIPLQTGLVPVIPGLPLQNGLTVRAYTSVNNVVKLDGFVNRITD